MEHTISSTPVPLYELEAVSCTAQHTGALAALRLLNSYNRLLAPPDVHGVVGPLLGTLPPQPQCLPPYCHHLPIRPTGLLSPPPTDAEVRRRGEKRPIPAELKDEKYFERRRRNNQAAKKSRDARRIREDQIAWRACLLEQENASLRAHLAALRQETLALRSLLATPCPSTAHCAPSIPTAPSTHCTPSTHRVPSAPCTPSAPTAPSSTTND